ncbi:hypothetical protein C8J57DRAFT_1213930 [Mycena rebaudengoi]|nr:hypothetical protein C8J57DRAFT_1213930 [Mycena rebaudengoi]
MTAQSKSSARPATSGRTSDVNRKTVRSTGMIQTSFLPARDVDKEQQLNFKDKWRGKNVLWYPARFLNHHPGIPNIEFKFRYLECIEWPLTEADLMGPSMYYKQDWTSCEEMLQVEFRPEQRRRMITALSPVHEWIAEPLFEPVEELTALMVRPLTQLQDFRLVSVPGPERRRWVLTVGRAMLQLLAIQYDLEEPLNLNGDTFEELVEGYIKRTHVESAEALRAMPVATKPKHAEFGQFAVEFYEDHTVPDTAYRPNTYRPNRPLEPRRPSVAVDIPRSTEDDEIMPAKTRRRKDSEDDEDTPAPKRQATSRSLRPRGNKGPHKE